MEKTELKFISGIRFFKPRDNAPKSIKGNIVIDLKELREFIKTENISDTIRIDLRKSDKTGNYYMTLNTWKPTQKTQDLPPVDYPEND